MEIGKKSTGAIGNLKKYSEKLQMNDYDREAIGKYLKDFKRRTKYINAKTIVEHGEIEKALEKTTNFSLELLNECDDAITEDSDEKFKKYLTLTSNLTFRTNHHVACIPAQQSQHAHHRSCDAPTYSHTCASAVPGPGCAGCSSAHIC